MNLICRVFKMLGVKFTRDAYYKHKKRGPSARSISDEEKIVVLKELYAAHYSCYGYRKMQVAMSNSGVECGLHQVRRLMKAAGLKGIHRADDKRPYTKSSPEIERFEDKLERVWLQGEPNQAWVADFTYMRTHIGFVYTAFVTDTASRKILAWMVGQVHNAPLVANTLEQAAAQRTRENPGFTTIGVIHHSDAGSEYRSEALEKMLTKLGMTGSIGTVGCVYDNSLMESTIGLYKTELIYRNKGNWRNKNHVELETAQWVYWYNHQRLHSSLGYQSPNNYEKQYKKDKEKT